MNAIEKTISLAGSERAVADAEEFELDESRVPAFLDKIVGDRGSRLSDLAADEGWLANVGFSLLFEELCDADLVSAPAGFHGRQIEVAPIAGEGDFVLVTLSAPNSGYSVSNGYTELSGLDGISLVNEGGRQELLECLEGVLREASWLLPAARMLAVDGDEDDA